uniref:microtubule-associated protein 10 n=1 Tax=Semicossyphus pulcher TaxID=241346 RepID=UPI0037E83366
MSGRKNSDNLETLFSFELLVENIRIEKASRVSDELAVGVRLLDFPTLLIYQHQQSAERHKQQDHDGRDEQGEFTFNRGKCCFFKMNLDSLHTQLANTPLYAMVLDVKEEIPRLVGTSLISLSKVVKRIRQDVTEHGASAPSSHSERGLVGLCNLSGEKIGSISLSYKLQSLGTSLLQHATERRGLKSNNAHVQESITDCGNISSPTQDDSDACRNNKPKHENTSKNEDKQDSKVCCDMQTEEKQRSQTPQTLEENNFEDDLTLFCPPHLFYCNSAEERSKNEGDCTSQNLNPEAFTFEDTSSEEGNKSQGACSPTVAQRGKKQAVKTSTNQETSGLAPNVLGEALQQLPLLNALLVELSQLNSQSPQQPLSIHPNLAWIYRPGSTQPSDRQNRSSQKTRQGVSPNFKHLLSPRNCSSPLVRPASVRAKDKQEESKSSGTSARKRLDYGTTKTFNLRMKQISPLRVKRRECVDLIQNETQSSKSKGKTKSSNKIRQSNKKKSDLKQSSSLNENIETVIQNIREDSAPPQTVTLKQKSVHGEVHGKQDGDSPGNSEKSSLPEGDSKCIHIPGMDSNIFAPNKDKNEDQSESNQSQDESDRHRENAESSGSSRNSSKSSFSDSDREGNEEEDYDDDFNSLEPSDAYSPDPGSSPEPSRANTPKSPIHPTSDSGSEGFHRKAALPVPVKAPCSPPQRALRGTHIIRPRTHASALSFSSEDADRDTSASLQTVRSRKQTTESSRAERSSGTDSLISSRGQGSSRNSRAAPGFSAESVSSFEPQEEEEDELGSLDFRKEYQHISKLVANKLPGYTM